MKHHNIHFPASILLGMSFGAHILNGDWFAALWCAVAWVLLVLHYQATSERDLYRGILSESLSKAKATPETKVDTPAASSSAPAAPSAGDYAKIHEALTKCYQLAYEWEANEREGIAGVEPGAKDSAETLFEIQMITTDALREAMK